MIVDYEGSEVMTFEEYAKEQGLYFTEDYVSDEFQIAQAAWEAAMKQINVADNQTLAALKNEGYVLVPVEPTEAMFKAGLGWRESDSELEGEYRMVYESYKAMIRAAQEGEY